MLCGDIKPGDVFRAGSDDSLDNLWVVLNVEPSDEQPGYIAVTYAYIHQLGQPDSVSTWHTDPSWPHDYRTA